MVRTFIAPSAVQPAYNQTDWIEPQRISSLPYPKGHSIEAISSPLGQSIVFSFRVDYWFQQQSNNMINKCGFISILERNRVLIAPYHSQNMIIRLLICCSVSSCSYCACVWVCEPGNRSLQFWIMHLSNIWLTVTRVYVCHLTTEPLTQIHPVESFSPVDANFDPICCNPPVAMVL